MPYWCTFKGSITEIEYKVDCNLKKCIGKILFYSTEELNRCVSSFFNGHFENQRKYRCNCRLVREKTLEKVCDTTL